MERLEQGLGYEWPRIAYQVFLTPVFYVVIRWLALTRTATRRRHPVARIVGPPLPAPAE